MKKIYTIALLLAAMLGGVSCSQDELTQTEQTATVAKPQGEVLTIAIDSEFEFSQQPGDGETARSLQLGRDDQGIPHIKLPTGENTLLRVFLRKIGGTSASTTTAYVPAKVTYNAATSRYRIEAKGPVQLQSANDRFDQGEWYVSAIWDGATTAPSSYSSEAQRLGHTLTALKPINAKNVTMDNPQNVRVPVVANWTRLESIRGGKTLTKLNLVFRPMGVLLAFDLSNETIYPIEISSVTANFSGFAVDGRLTVENVTDADLRAGASLSLVNSSQKEQFITPESVTLQPFQVQTSPVYLWLYPQDGATAGHGISFSFASSKRNALDSTLGEQDRFGENNWASDLQDFYKVDYKFERVPVSGTYFRKTLSLQSQLTITEYYIQNYDNTAYGYVEIYNPNVRPVVLENYALIRILDGENYTTNKVQQGHYYPMVTSIWDTSGQTHKASVLSLGMKPGPSPWVPNSLGINSQADIAAGAPAAPMSESYNRPEQVRFVLQKPTYNKDGKYTLEGGKTMLVLLAGYMKGGTLTQPGNNNVYALPEYTEQAFTKGYCQYVVALNNPEAGSTGTSWRDLSTGVTNINQLDAFALVQKHQSNQKRRRGVDATSLTSLMYLGSGDWPYYRSNAAAGATHFRGRTASQHTSDSEFHTYRQFFIARLDRAAERGNREFLPAPIARADGQLEIQLPSKVVSPGVRRYVGNTKAAWDALPQFDLRTHPY